MLSKFLKVLLIIVGLIVLSTVVTFVLQYMESTQIEQLTSTTTITISNETTFGSPFNSFVKKGYFDSVGEVYVYMSSPYANYWNTFNVWMSLDNSSWTIVPFLESTTNNHTQMANLGFINLGNPQLTIYQKYYVPPQTILLPPNVTKEDASVLKSNVSIKKQATPADTIQWILIFFAVSGFVGCILAPLFSAKDSNFTAQNGRASDRNDLFFGLVIGLVGNLLVSTAFALLEHPEWTPYLNPMYVLSWIGFVLFCSVLLIKKKKIEKIEPEEIAKTSKEPGKAKRESLIAEYHVLNEATWKRGRDNLVVNSIIVSTTLAIVTFAIRFRTGLGKNILFDLPNAGFVPIVSSILLLVSYLLWWTSAKLDCICFDRIYEIEDILHIKGNQHIRDKIKYSTWYKIRRNIWHFFFLFLIIAYLFTSAWLFRETVLVVQ